MSRARVWFLEGLPTITSIVEGFGGVPSAIEGPACSQFYRRNETPYRCVRKARIDFKGHLCTSKERLYQDGIMI